MRPMRWDAHVMRRLKLRDLHYLMTVVQSGSMAKAASVLAVSQPVISRVIAEMEHTLGARMLDRSPRGVEPTIYGRRLIASSYAIFDELRQGVVAVEHLTNPAVGELSIASNEDSTLGVVPLVLEELRRTHPRVFVEVTLANTPQDQRNELTRRSIEFAIGHTEPHAADPEIATEVLFHEHFSILAARDNPWARRRRIELAELIGRPWIMPAPDTLNGKLIAAMFRARRLEPPQGRVRTSSLQLTQSLLEDGPFLALLPTSVLSSLANPSALRVLPVALPELATPIGVIKMADRELSPMARIFVEVARIAARTLVPSRPGDER